MTESDLAEARRLRDEARALVRGDLLALRNGLDSRPIGQRIKDRAADEVADVLESAKDVAVENTAVIAATGAALAGWLLRGPIIEAGRRLLRRWQ